MVFDKASIYDHFIASFALNIYALLESQLQAIHRNVIFFTYSFYQFNIIACLLQRLVIL